MKLKLSSIVIIILMLITFTNVYSKNKDGHFYDEKRNHLVQYDSIYDELTKFFNDKVPKKITVKYITDGNTSRFNPSDNTVLILEEHARQRPIPIVGHESCHISMAHFTKSASTKEEFRFFDEGFASIFEHMLDNDSDIYKKTSLSIAAQQNLNNNVSFKKVQKWSEYFGNPKVSVAKYAYPVGSSFVYYIVDSYGMDTFLTFCQDLGKTYNLDKSFRKILHKDKYAIEAEWQEYLCKVPIIKENKILIIGNRMPCEKLVTKYSGYSEKKMCSPFNVLQTDFDVFDIIFYLKSPEIKTTNKYVDEKFTFLDTTSKCFLNIKFVNGRKYIFLKADSETKLIECINAIDRSIIDKEQFIEFN